jgi:hypothetical protein
MSFGNHAYDMYFFLCQVIVFLNWRFLTSPPYGGFVRNDNINWCSVMGKQWRFAQWIATASLMSHKTLSFRALARNLIINCFEIIIDTDTHIKQIQIIKDSEPKVTILNCSYQILSILRLWIPASALASPSSPPSGGSVPRCLLRRVSIFKYKFFF